MSILQLVFLPETKESSVVEVIGAVGAVVSSCIALYLVHRRILADRATKSHRVEECEVQEALIKKLGLQIRRLEREAKKKT